MGVCQVSRYPVNVASLNFDPDFAYTCTGWSWQPHAFSIFWSWRSPLSIFTNNVVETITNHPFGNDLYHLFMVIWEMVYYRFYHITIYVMYQLYFLS